MSKITRIEIGFPVAVEVTEEVQRFLDEALTAICEDYEMDHTDRVMWVFGVGGTPPPGFMFDEPVGDWDMSVLNFEIMERERYASEITSQHSALRKVFHERDKFRDQAIDTCKRAERAEKALQDETGWLVERVHLGRPMWLTLQSPHAYGWTGDSLEALRFGRADDAQAFAKTYVTDEVRITDHAWIGVRASERSQAAQRPAHDRDGKESA